MKRVRIEWVPLRATLTQTLILLGMAVSLIGPTIYCVITG